MEVSRPFDHRDSAVLGRSGKEAVGPKSLFFSRKTCWNGPLGSPLFGELFYWTF